MKPYDLSVRAFLFNGAGQLLLLRRHLRSAHFAGEWELPGGKVNPGERVGEALRREVLEETGLEAEPDGVAGASEFELPHVRVVTLCFHARIAGGKVTLSPEHEDFAWAGAEEIERLGLTRSTRDALACAAHHPRPVPASPAP
jgi:8-oxo-dGTP diphosphatase